MKIKSLFEWYDFVCTIQTTVGIVAIYSAIALHFLGFSVWVGVVALVLSVLSVGYKVLPLGEILALQETTTDMYRKMRTGFALARTPVLTFVVLNFLFWVVVHLVWWENHPVRMAQIYCLSVLLVSLCVCTLVKRRIILAIVQTHNNDVLTSRI